MQFNQIFDREKLEEVITKYEFLIKFRDAEPDDDVIKKCKSLLEESKQYYNNINILTMNYTQAKNHRFYSDNEFYSMQNINRIIRHTISKDLYYDIDIKNAFPCIL